MRCGPWRGRRILCARRLLRATHGPDLRATLAAHPELVARAAGLVRLRDVNPATLRMFGASNKQQLLASLPQIFRPETFPVFASQMVAVAEGDRIFSAEAPLRTLAGERIDVALTLAILPDGDGYERTLVTLTDVSAHRLVQREREARIAEMERAVRFGELFVGVVGHDLRNPLSAITTSARLLEQRADSERMTAPLGRILASAERMDRMISQLLDFTRIRLGGGLPLQRVRVDLAAVSRSIIDELEPVHERRSVFASRAT